MVRSHAGHDLTHWKGHSDARMQVERAAPPARSESVDKLATGYRARYFGPDGRRYKAPTLFLTKAEARGWLALRHAEIIRKAWEPPEATDHGDQDHLRRLRRGVAGPTRTEGPHPRALP